MKVAYVSHMTKRSRLLTRARSFIAPFADPTRIRHVAAVSIASGLLAYRNPASVGVLGRIGLRAGSAMLSGFVMWCGLRYLEHDFFRRPLRAGLTAAGVGSAFAFAESMEAIDVRVHGALVRRRVKRPRVVMACVAAVAMALAYIPGRSTPPADSEGVAPGEEMTIEVPVEVRRLIEALLSVTESWDATVLREQLAQARAIEYVGGDAKAFYPAIGFAVPDEATRYVPYSANFPVVGRYRPLDGRSADVYLTVTDGRLANLTIASGSDWNPDEVIDWMDGGGTMQDITTWPSPDELTFLIETATGLRPLTSPTPGTQE